MSYSKQVINHFQNPKNFGKMADPSAIGKVGNPICGDLMHLYIKVEKNKQGEEFLSDVKFQAFGCLPLDEEISANEGDWQKIGEIKKGDYVLNGKGVKSMVKNRLIRDYEGHLLEIVPFVSRINKFSLTPNHPVLAIKRSSLSRARPSGGPWLRVDKKEIKNKKPEFIPAQNLEAGDYLVYQTNTVVRDSKTYSQSLMRLLGYYLAEGYVVANNSVVAFSFNKKEKMYIDEVEKLIKKMTGKEASQRIRGNVCEIYFCSRRWVKFFVAIAGKYAHKKRLCQEILVLPFKKQLSLIETFKNGDGNSYRRRPQGYMTHRLATASQELAINLQEMLARGGIFSSIKKSDHPNRKIIEGRRVNTKPIYEVSYRLRRKRQYFYYRNGFFLVPIWKIVKKKFRGLVANLEMAGNSQAYLVKGYVVHNCVAALATSSAITEMAKGKTLKEAIGISSTQ